MHIHQGWHTRWRGKAKNEVKYQHNIIFLVTCILNLTYRNTSYSNDYRRFWVQVHLTSSPKQTANTQKTLKEDKFTGLISKDELLSCHNLEVLFWKNFVLVKLLKLYTHSRTINSGMRNINKKENVHQMPPGDAKLKINKLTFLHVF